MNISKVVKVNKNDLVSFQHPKIKSQKPEIVKADYIQESLEEVSSQMEDLLTEKLKSKGINPPIKYHDRVRVYDPQSKRAGRPTRKRAGSPVEKKQLWFQDGLRCEILNFEDQSWRKGRFRIKLNVAMEFIPDEVDSEESASGEKSQDNSSPLDEIRQSMQ